MSQSKQDIRWEQRFSNFHKALSQLLKYKEKEGLNEMEKQGLIKAFANGLISDGEVWMLMLESRSKTSHTYNEETAEEITRDVLADFIPLFVEFENKLKTLTS